MARAAAVISFRLGGNDGVGVEARKWSWALGELGFTVRRIAGNIEGVAQADDAEIAGLAIHTDVPTDVAALAVAIDGADVVVAENVCSLPLNPDAARAVARVLGAHGGRVLFRHHDLPWQRRHLAHLADEFPPRVDGALHATVNLRSRRELEARGYRSATCIHNYFDLDSACGEREATRLQFGFDDADLVIFQPARAIERKNVPGGLRFAARLGQLMPDARARYWLSGPAEDGYDPTLDRILERAPLPVTLGRADNAADAYAASDVVVFPSTWEGFGNPTIESIPARRPCAAFAYPVLAEILAAGPRVFSTDDPEGLARFLREDHEVQQQYFDANLRRARVSFDLRDLPAAIEAAFVQHGWTAW